MLEAFSRPRIEGTFTGDGMRAWDVVWGQGTADVVIENSYADVKNAVIDAGGSRDHGRRACSRSAIRGKDGGEEINARVRLTRRPMADLRHAFELDDYHVDGLVSGEFHVYGDYETPFGFGRLLIEDGVAYGETFESAPSALRFEGNGVRLDTIRDRARATGERHRRGVGRLGRHLFVQRRRPPHPGRVAEDRGVSAARRCPACCSSTRPAPATSTSRATT